MKKGGRENKQSFGSTLEDLQTNCPRETRSLFLHHLAQASQFHQLLQFLDCEQKEQKDEKKKGEKEVDPNRDEIEHVVLCGDSNKANDVGVFQFTDELDLSQELFEVSSRQLIQIKPRPLDRHFHSHSRFPFEITKTKHNHELELIE